VGLEFQAAVRGLQGAALARGLIAAGAVSAVVIGTRVAWLYTTPYLIRMLDRRPQPRLRRVGARPGGHRNSGLPGGGVARLSARGAADGRLGRAVPGRNVIVLVTAGVIVVTLAQALLLPSVVGWARLPRGTSAEAERHLAETLATEEALAAIPQLAVGLGTDPEVTGRLRRDYEKHLRVLRAGGRRRRRAGAAVRPARWSRLALGGARVGLCAGVEQVPEGWRRRPGGHCEAGLYRQPGQRPEGDPAHGHQAGGGGIEHGPGGRSGSDLGEGVLRGGQRRAGQRFEPGVGAGTQDQVVERRVVLAWRQAQRDAGKLR
jgi:hypothetical protein